jgi:hypothetical protein
MFSSSTSLRIVAVFLYLIANLYVYANAAELETPLSGILGGDIDGLAQSDNFGSALAISADGNRIVVGARNHDASNQGTNYYDVGSVRVFEYGTATNPTGWSQVGSDIDGVAPSDYFGYAVAISSDGNRIVVGAPNADSTQNVTYTYSSTCYNYSSYPYYYTCNNTYWYLQTQLAGRRWVAKSTEWLSTINSEARSLHRVMEIPSSPAPVTTSMPACSNTARPRTSLAGPRLVTL